MSRKRNLDACRERAEARAEEVEIAATIKRIRGNVDVCPPFPPVPAAITWLALFARDATRYPIIVVLGPSMSGKTEWAKTLFQSPLEMRFGELEPFPRRAHPRGVSPPRAAGTPPGPVPSWSVAWPTRCGQPS